MAWPGSALLARTEHSSLMTFQERKTIFMVASDAPLVALVGPIFSSVFFRANFIICLQSLPVPKFICHLLWSCIKANRCVFHVGCVFSPVKVTRTKVVSSFIFVVTRVRNKLFGYMHSFRDLWMPVGLWSIIFCMLLAFIPFVKFLISWTLQKVCPIHEMISVQSCPVRERHKNLSSSWNDQFHKLCVTYISRHDFIESWMYSFQGYGRLKKCASFVSFVTVFVCLHTRQSIKREMK
jgi:hypothetical protein